jgi:hypothetical protein
MPTQSIYFKFRRPFDFLPYPFEIGNFLGRDKLLEDNFFLLKLYDINEQDFANYYEFHLTYFLENHPNEQEGFFDHILDIIKVRIDYFKKLKPFTRTYARNMANVRNLEAFVAFMKTVDRWHKLETIESVIAEKGREIDRLNARVAALEAELKEARIYDTAEKVNITKGGIAAFMDLMKQIQNLPFEANARLVNAQTQAPYYKMIAKYFKHGDKEISIDTARNYFPATKGDKPAKFIEIAEKDKRYKIVPYDKGQA